MIPGSETVSPKVSTMTKVSYATTRTGEKTQIGYVQSVSEFLTAPEEITYSAKVTSDAEYLVQNMI